MKRVWLTTIDNPFDPLTEFDNWFAFDTDKGYNTCSYLARLATISPELSEEQNHSSIERAVDDIVRLNVLGLYKKITNEEKAS